MPTTLRPQARDRRPRRRARQAARALGDRWSAGARPLRRAGHREDDAVGGGQSSGPQARAPRALVPGQRRRGAARVRRADRPARQVDEAALDGLPAPQRRALEVALLRASPGNSPARRTRSPSASSARSAGSPRESGCSSRSTTSSGSTAPSADALAFAARRLGDEPVALPPRQAARAPSALEQALEPAALERLDVGPLSLGAVRRLLAERLGLSLPRPLLRRIVDTTLGNPLFALEVGRALAEQRPAGDRRGAPGAGRGRGAARHARGARCRHRRGGCCSPSR